tara:strand:+ start:189 stop:1067 length:879 start_codon:yes stop_codon:yes gene_type:complete
VVLSDLKLDKWCCEWSSDGVGQSPSPLIMGVVNTTPDSFSDGGSYIDCGKATEHALRLIAEGADVIDIGGESSRPGSKPVSLEEERRRVIPVIRKLSQQTKTPISVDTYKAEIMIEAVEAGALMINDIKALQSEESLKAAAELNIPVCLMHMQGVPESMQQQINYNKSIVEEINIFFDERLKACDEAGIDRKKIILDPGFGFGKQVHHNLQLVKNIKAFYKHQRPVLLGVSRKSTLGIITGEPVEKRLIAGMTLTIHAVLDGLSMIRTHDVHETHQAFKILTALTDRTVRIK